jgi:dihydroorotate dehydrogenase
MINEAMGGRLYRAILAAARRVDAERAHRWGIATIRLAGHAPGALQQLVGSLDDPALRVRALGIDFPNPLGLAAGFDKDARAVAALAALGFGFVEVGTITAVPQAGSPRPRLHRLVEDRAIVNRMGFNNDGAAAVAARLKQLQEGPSRPVVGVNIGKSRVVPDEHAVVDYVASTRLLAPYADYLVVNVSSPNTPGLRDLQSVGKLRPLLTAVRTTGDVAAGRRVPLLVTIWPTMMSSPSPISRSSWAWTGSSRRTRPRLGTACARRLPRLLPPVVGACPVSRCGNGLSTCSGFFASRWVRCWCWCPSVESLPPRRPRAA